MLRVLSTNVVKLEVVSKLKTEEDETKCQTIATMAGIEFIRCCSLVV